MTMTSIGSIEAYPASQDLTWSGSSANATFDTSTDVLSVIFQIPATGTLSNIHYRIVSVSSPSMTHRIELRTVDGTTGKPNAAGTLYGSSSSVTVSAATYAANTNYTATVNATATAGDVVALVFDLSAFTSGSFNQLMRFGGQLDGGVGQFPYQMTNTAAADVLAVLQINAFALEYGADTYYPLNFTALVGTVAQVTVSNSGVTRRGNRLRSAVPRRACGIWIEGDLDGDCFLRLRKQSDDSVLATVTVDASDRASGTAGKFEYLFDGGTTFNLVAGTDYYVLVEGNSATTDGIYLLSNVPENAQLDGLSGGKNTYGTSYNAGYTDVNTSRYSIGIIYDGLDDGAGGSGGGGQRVIGG